MTYVAPGCPRCRKVDYRLLYDAKGGRTGGRACNGCGQRW